MNKKLLAIKVLRERVSSMQQQLKKLQKETLPKPIKSKSKSLTKSNDKNGSPFRNTSSNKRYKSPTFWTGNPIMGQQNPYFSQKTLSPLKKHQRKQQSTSYKSPFLQKIKNQVDLSFYQSAPIDSRNKENYQSVKQQSKNLFGKKDDCGVFQQFKKTQKIQKKKTYQFFKKDPILNPQPNKVSCRKSPIKITPSPKNMLTQNPNSNPNLYFVSTQPIKLRQKVKYQNYRNNSPDLKLLLSNSSSATNLAEHSNRPSTPTSSKKHYGRYYQDNLASKWNINW